MFGCQGIRSSITLDRVPDRAPWPRAEPLVCPVVETPKVLVRGGRRDVYVYDDAHEKVNARHLESTVLFKVNLRPYLALDEKERV